MAVIFVLNCVEFEVLNWLRIGLCVGCHATTKTSRHGQIIKLLFTGAMKPPFKVHLEAVDLNTKLRKV
jgi:hypothetical protein